MRQYFPVKAKLPRFSKLVFIALVLLAFLVPTPYVLLSPGEPQNILTKAISISGAEVFPSKGKLSVTSVMVTNPDSYMTGFDVLYGWVRGEQAVLPRVEIYPENESTVESTQQGAADMQQSQVNATAAALTLLGYKGETKLLVNSINDKTDAVNNLKIKDQLIAVEGTTLTSASQVINLLKSKKPGDILNLTVLRGASENPLQVKIKLSAREDGSAFIGITISTEQKFPITVKIKLDETGGPSGGLIFALGIIEKLGSEDLLRGRNIAGTGTITDTGEVGPIGGITEKIIGAKKDGVEIFLAPIDNCSDISSPDLFKGIQIVPVSTLTQALSVLRAPTGAKLAACPVN